MKEFRTFFKADIPKKEKKTAKQNWDALKKRAFDKAKKKMQPLMDADEKFMKQIWDSRPHYCVEGGCDLGGEYKKIFFDHILSKKDYPALRYDEANIQLLCMFHHSAKHHGKSLSKFQLQMIHNTKKYFDIEE